MSGAAELARLDATGQAELVRRGDVSAVELVEAAIASIEKLNPQLNAVVTPTFERALDARAYWDMGRHVSAADYLLAIEDCQAFARVVARFLGDYDVWLTPTLSTPPLLLGEIVSTPEEPFRALERGGPTVAYAGVVANITGSPAMSVPLFWNDAGLPIGVHFLGRFGDEATLFQLASQLEAARPWQARRPSVTAVG